MFVSGCEKFITALACLFLLALAGSCLARFAYFLADLCISQNKGVLQPIIMWLASLSMKLWFFREYWLTGEDQFHR